MRCRTVSSSALCILDRPTSSAPHTREYVILFSIYSMLYSQDKRICYLFYSIYEIFRLVSSSDLCTIYADWLALILSTQDMHTI